MELLESVPPFVSRVGVCRNPEDVKPDQRSRLEVLQIYNHKAIRPAGEVPQSIPVFRLRSSEDFDVMETALSNIGPQAMVLDAYTEFSLGGAGVSFDWSLAVEAKARFGVRVILAGGLTPENVADAIRQVRPYAVDVSSGVESSTVGRKDHEKLKKFMSAVRGA
jgi:phosphoribosylanthranilate isomerase